MCHWHRRWQHTDANILNIERYQRQHPEIITFRYPTASLYITFSSGNWFKKTTALGLQIIHRPGLLPANSFPFRHGTRCSNVAANLKVRHYTEAITCISIVAKYLE